MKIVGHDYKIKFVPDLRSVRDAGKRVYGEASYEDAKISISSDMPKELIEETLLHEILHVIIFHTNERKDHNEAAISAIANGLYLLGVGKFLMEKAKK